MKILIGEPDEYYHVQYRTHLGSLGELAIIKEGAGMQNFMRRILPDAIVTEMILADMTIYPILEDISRNRRKYGMPVIIYTHVDHLEDVKTALGFGVSSYFVKGQDSIADIKKYLLNFAN